MALEHYTWVETELTRIQVWTRGDYDALNRMNRDEMINFERYEYVKIG